MEYKSLHFSKSQTSILKHLYTILTDDNEILLILFNQLYCGKNNIKSSFHSWRGGNSKSVI